MNITLNKLASHEIKMLRKSIAKKLNLPEEMVSYSMVIHELYTMYVSRNENKSD